MMDMEKIRAIFEHVAPEAPFPLDLTKDQQGMYINKVTQECFQTFAVGYSDGCRLVENTIDKTR